MYKVVFAFLGPIVALSFLGIYVAYDTPPLADQMVQGTCWARKIDIDKDTNSINPGSVVILIQNRVDNQLKITFLGYRLQDPFQALALLAKGDVISTVEEIMNNNVVETVCPEQDVVSL